MDNNSYNLANLIVNIFIAFGTIAVAVIAIWGDWIKSILFPPRIKVSFPEKFGTLTHFTNTTTKVIYYHLKIENLRKNFSIKNCKVVLTSIYKKLPNGEFDKIVLPVPVRFIWAPAAPGSESITISNYELIDFLRIIENQDVILPNVSILPNDFNGFIKSNETMRYELEIKADGYKPKQNQIFQISWDGIFNESILEMNKHLIVEEIK